MKRAYLICPVRGHSPSESEPYVVWLEGRGWDVYWPHRDTNQDDPVGLEICMQNREAIERADCIFLIFDPSSSGSLFDLGMAFALEKPLVILDAPPPDPGVKSFTVMIRAWQEATAEWEDRV